MPNKTNKYINQSNKNTTSQYLFNRKNTATKTPRTPSQSKEYANQNTKYAISIKRVTNQNTKYAISIKRICQPKHQVRHLNQKSMPTKTPRTPSQSKEYANQNTKYAISIKRVLQQKHQIHQEAKGEGASIPFFFIIKCC